MISVLQFRPASSAPADIFSIPAPVIGSDPPKAADIKAGDATVSTQTGALTWSYPIMVPPGRNGMAPSLSLAYSSQAPVYGGIAVGFAWNLGVPEIREDTSESRIKTRSPTVELTQQDPKKDDRFTGLGGRRLVLVGEEKGADAYGAYRAQGDDGFQRYERISQGPPYWRVRSMDGSIMYFGGYSNGTAVACSNVSDGYAPLAEQLDAFGSSIKYTYEELIGGECRLKMIEWGAGTGVQHFARVELEWLTAWPGGPVGGTCNGIPVGSHTDYRTGAKIVTGASNLSKIRATAFPPGVPGSPVHTREITLNYSATHMQCDRSHAPLRRLTSIQESAWITGAPHVDLPAVTLEYGDPAVLFATPAQSEPQPWSDGVTGMGDNLAWGYRYVHASTDSVDRTPTVESMLVDLDGDGLLDRLYNDSTATANGLCRAVWQKNMGTAAGSTQLSNFSGWNEITLPRLKWHGPVSSPPPTGSTTADEARGEKCSLAGQVTAFKNSNSGLGCHTGLPGFTACQQGSDYPNDPTLYCYPNGRECPPSQTVPEANHTYLHYRWIDADGDGLTDLVAAVHGDIRTYDIEQGNEPISNPPLPEPLLFGPWPACPNDVDRCKDVNPDCIIGADEDPSEINECIENAPTIPCNDLIKAPYGAPQSIDRGPYTRCEGLYPWFIFKNTGNGNFANPVIKYQPVPLESNRGDSSLGHSSGWVSQRHGIVDFDGDGILDAIASPHAWGGPAWWVWLGDGTGGFEAKRHTFLTRTDALLSQSGFVPLASVGDTEGLFDLNADGYPDHWQLIPGQANATVVFNTGTRHSASGMIETPTAGSWGVKPGNDTSHTITDGACIPPHPPQWYDQKCTYHEGTTRAQTRVFDLDHDGRLDVVFPLPLEGPPSVSFNLGGQFNWPVTQVNVNAQGLKRLTSVEPVDPDKGMWQLLSDHIDLDGDGIAEIVDFELGSYKRARQLNAEPPRLLTKVHNGRGAHTTITYASMHDKAAVEQETDPDSAPFWMDRWGRERPNASPRTQWVAKSVSTTDDFSNTTSTTSYFYKYPRYGADDEGKHSFRGFAEVSATGPSGASNVQRFGYDVDWSGRLVETLQRPSTAEMDDPDSYLEVRSISRVEWTARQLFGGALETYHTTASESFVCFQYMSEEDCKAEPAGYTRTETEQTALGSGLVAGPALLWADTSSTLLSDPPSDGDRRTTQTFFVYSNDSNYRVRPRITTREHRVSGAWTVYGNTSEEWDPTYRVPVSNELLLGKDQNNNPITAITYFEYDLTTGNLKKRWKPKQWVTNKFTENTFDSRKLFVATEVNELGHRRDYTYEYGTGTKLMSEGPNQRTCTTGPTCPSPDDTYPLKERHKVVVDGLGRTIEIWDTVSDDGTLYQLFQRSTTSYVDTVSGSIPTSVTNRVRLSTTSGVWTEQKTEIDGHGRPIKETSFVQGSAPADHVTVYTYRNDGTLATVQVPDPTQNSSARVTYTYTFDSLGRPTSIRRPDGATPLSQSGVDIFYNGMLTSVSAVAPATTGGGALVGTMTFRDNFGRVAQVHERTSTSEWAITSYTYGPDDNVQTVTDPDGVSTTLKHDLAGRRTEITRHGRTWKYTYDKNGNLDSETAPGSPGPLMDPNYVTTISYDDLDRPLTKYIGQRTLPPTDQTLFASWKETYEWDTGGNNIGRLRYWRSFAPNSSSFAVEHSTRFNSQGQLVTNIETLRIAGFPELERRFSNRYHLFGGVSETWFEDPLGGTNKTKAFTHYDPRGLPTHVVLKRGGQTDHTLAVQTRNVAGLVTKRRTDTSGGMTFVESNWTYDKLGRVSSQVVQKGPGPTQVVRQDLAYTGHDNPKTLTHHLGTNAKQFDFTYDNRHQLKTVSSTTAGYFGATYYYGAGGRFTRATESQTINPLPAGTEVKPRDVNYVYGDADPERVTALVNVSNGTTYSGYTYDAAGNTTQRCYGGSGVPNCAGESTEYLYDGKDQLRRATKKVGGVVQGSEEYWYDGTGQRIAVVKRDAAGTKTGMTWFIGETEAHYNGAGSVTRIYSHVSLGTPVARVERTSNTTTSVEYQFHGLSNNTIAAVAQNGTINASFSYAPFGELIETTNGGGASAGVAAHPRRMNDKFVDDVSSLAYYGVRYYDKTSMTWTQSDPLYRFAPDAAWTEPRRASLYTMSLNNPLRYIDPDGRDSTPGVDPFKPTIEPNTKYGGPSPKPQTTPGPKPQASPRAGARLGVAVVVVVVAVVGVYAGLKVGNWLDGNPSTSEPRVGPTDGTGCGSYCTGPEATDTTPKKDPRDPMKKGDKPFGEPYPDPGTPVPGREGEWPPEPWDPTYPIPPSPPWPGWPNPPPESSKAQLQQNSPGSAPGAESTTPAMRTTNPFGMAGQVGAPAEQCIPCQSPLHQYVPLATQAYKAKSNLYVQGLWGIEVRH